MLVGFGGDDSYHAVGGAVVEVPSVIKVDQALNKGGAVLVLPGFLEGKFGLDEGLIGAV